MSSEWPDQSAFLEVLNEVDAVSSAKINAVGKLAVKHGKVSCFCKNAIYIY